jgi:dihydrofolate reductase
MRKVILYIATSLDSFIAGKNDDISWLFTDADYGYSAFSESIDAVLSGRKTFDISADLGEIFPGKTVYVFTRQQKTDHNNIYFINSDIPDFVKQLKKQKGKNIWLLGGAEINTLLHNEKLIDEYIVSIHPAVIGEGTPLFNSAFRDTLKFISVESFESGLVQLKYSVIK